ncbi:MAG TPA: hypothetical protein VKD00_06885 [Methyloceanibacter sp.]|nr:hypothetical protein [Methyloceanibacter sp.]
MPRRRIPDPPRYNPLLDSIEARVYKGHISYKSLIRWYKPDQYVGRKPLWSLETLNGPPRRNKPY